MNDGAKPGERRPIRLGDLTVWVLGAAVFFAMVRGATGLWGSPVPALNADRVAGVVLLAILSAVVGRLVADTIASGRAFGRVWRWVAVMLLLGLALTESVVLSRDDRSMGIVAWFNETGWPAKLLALALAIGLIGVMLGIAPTRPRRGQIRRRSGVVSIVFSGMSGLLILTAFQMVVPYMVLIAIDVVYLAQGRPAMMNGKARFGHAIEPLLLDGRAWVSLPDRLITSGIVAALGMIACGLTAHWLGRDLRGEVRGPRSWAAVSYRASTALAAWGMGVYALFVGVPRLQPWLAEGFWNVISPLGTGAIAAAFVALAAGLAARGVAGPIEPGLEVDSPRGGSHVPRLVVLVLKGLLTAGLAMLIFAAVSQIRGDESLPWDGPYRLKTMLIAAEEMLTIKTNSAIYFDPGKAPEVVVLLAAVVGIIWVLPRTLLGPNPTAPIDRIADDPRLIGRFLGAWWAMLGVMFALFPTFVLGGLALIHVALRMT